jgi:predicted O-methyltransferase YrrM
MKTLTDLQLEKNRCLDYGPPAPVPVFQHVWELSRLLDLYKQRKPKRVLEVGTYHGGTLYHWLQNAVKGAMVISLDSYAVGVDNRAMYPDWTPGGVTLHALCGDSHATETALEVGRFGPFDWIFIDAGHYYNEVEKDWDIYGQMAAEGAVVVLHDISPPHPNHPEIEVNKLWREIQARGYVTQELIASPTQDWGGLGIVYLP